MYTCLSFTDLHIYWVHGKLCCPCSACMSMFLPWALFCVITLTETRSWSQSPCMCKHRFGSWLFNWRLNVGSKNMFIFPQTFGQQVNIRTFNLQYISNLCQTVWQHIWNCNTKPLNQLHPVLFSSCSVSVSCVGGCQRGYWLSVISPFQNQENPSISSYCDTHVNKSQKTLKLKESKQYKYLVFKKQAENMISLS